jgi:hypothetical protein
VAIDAGLYDRANHAQVVKLFSTHLDRVSESYSPAKFVSVAKATISNTPDLDRAGTSHVERHNGTLRQWCKRLTRLTYAFPKSWANFKAALALHFWHYNFLSDSLGAKDYACDGCRDLGPRVEFQRIGRLSSSDNEVLVLDDIRRVIFHIPRGFV